MPISTLWVQTCLELAKVQGEVQRVQSHIIDLTTSLSEALAEREAQSTAPAARQPPPDRPGNSHPG